MTNPNETQKQNAKVAEFRFALIAPVVHDTYVEPSATPYFKRVTENPITTPDGHYRKYSYKTLQKWKEA